MNGFIETPTVPFYLAKQQPRARASATAQPWPGRRSALVLDLLVVIDGLRKVASLQFFVVEVLYCAMADILFSIGMPTSKASITSSQRCGSENQVEAAQSTCMTEQACERAHLFHNSAERLSRARPSRCRTCSGPCSASISEHATSFTLLVHCQTHSKHSAAA